MIDAPSNLLVEGIFTVDEFGRNHLISLLLGAALSITRAVYMALLLFLVAGALAICVELSGSRIGRQISQILVDALESVPIYVWVLAAVSWAPQYRNTITTSVFVIAGLPLVFNTLRGIVSQIMHKPFYLAAIALGTNKLQLARNHIVPNLLPHSFPLVLYVVGVALAIYGGIGVFGFVNRNELDLGVFLLRGKEQAGFDPTLLLLTLGAYAAIFAALQFLIKRTQKRISRTTEKSAAL